MRVMRTGEIRHTLGRLTKGDPVRVVYEIDGDWAVAICQYDSHHVEGHTTMVTFRLHDRMMVLGLPEIVELDAR